MQRVESIDDFGSGDPQVLRDLLNRFLTVDLMQQIVGKRIEPEEGEIRAGVSTRNRITRRGRVRRDGGLARLRNRPNERVS